MADNIILSRPGAANNTFTNEGVSSTLFLKLFAGEVLQAFDEYNVASDLVMVRQAPAGAKSAQFIITGRAAARGLLPDSSGQITNIFADSLFAQQIRNAEKEVFVDGPIVAPMMITEFDEMRQQYDARSIYAQELGRAVAEEYDTRAFWMVANGARSATQITATAPDNDRAGIRFSDADFITNGASAAATAYVLMQKLDEKFVPRLDRHLVITPGCYANLVQQTDLLNRDWNDGKNGDFADGTVFKLAAFQLHVSTHVVGDTTAANNLATNRPGAINDFGGASAPNNANGATAAAAPGDFRRVVGLAFHKSGVGAVQLQGMSVESDYFLEYQSTGVVAKKIVGLSFLRPEACVEIVDN